MCTEMAAWHGSCCSTISWSSLKIKNVSWEGYLRLYCHPGWFNHLREMLFAEQWQTPASSHRPKERFSLAQGQFLLLNEVWQQRAEIPEVCPSPTQPAVQAQLPNVHLVGIPRFAQESFKLLHWFETFEQLHLNPALVIAARTRRGKILQSILLTISYPSIQTQIPIAICWESMKLGPTAVLLGCLSSPKLEFQLTCSVSRQLTHFIRSKIVTSGMCVAP